MKMMTCKQLKGACDQEFKPDTFEEIAELSKKHGMEMFQKGDKEHLEAMDEMKILMSEEEAMQKWMKNREREFDTLPECR